MYRLVFLSGHYEGKRIVVRQAITLAGRDTECHLVLPGDEQMAGQHAVFEETGQGVFLTPLSPGHPILCNGTPADGAIRLAHNDEITLGQTRLVFQDIIAPQGRLHASSGILLPVAFLLMAAILVLEFGLLAYLVHWPRRLIRPETEAADLAFAEQRKAAEDQEETAPTPIITLPGTTSATDAPPAVAGAESTPEIIQVLEEADFAPAHTNIAMAELPARSGADPRIEEAQRLLAEAVTAADFADYATAIRLLNQLHQTEPDFLPAHAEHARLLEARGDLDAARQRWIQILGIAPEGSPFREQAVEQRQRLDELRALQTQLVHATEPVDLAGLPRHVRIVTPGLQRLPADTDVSEMRILSLALERSPSEQLFDDAVLQVFITFYDSAPEAAPRPTRAITTPSPMLLQAGLAGRDRLTLEATYVVPRGLRAQETRSGGTEYSYYGYTIHVFAGRILQDAFGKPRKLLEQPIHFSAGGD